MLEQIKSVRAQVKYCLEKDPPCRDDDKRLWIQCMLRFHGLRTALSGLRGQRAVDAFVDWFLDGDVPSMESVRRCRQWLQERHPGLRGETWNQRHGEARKIRSWARTEAML